MLANTQKSRALFRRTFRAIAPCASLVMCPCLAQAQPNRSRPSPPPSPAEKSEAHTSSPLSVPPKAETAPIVSKPGHPLDSKPARHATHRGKVDFGSLFPPPKMGGVTEDKKSQETTSYAKGSDIFDSVRLAVPPVVSATHPNRVSTVTLPTTGITSLDRYRQSQEAGTVSVHANNRENRDFLYFPYGYADPFYGPHAYAFGYGYDCAYPWAFPTVIYVPDPLRPLGWPNIAE